MKRTLPLFDSLEKALKRIRSDPFMELLPDGILVTDHNRNVVYMNGQAMQMLGTKRNEAMGRACWEVLRSDVCKDCPTSQGSQEESAWDHFNIDVLTQDDRVLACCMHTAVLRGSTGEILGYIESFREMGEVRSVMEEQKKLLELYSYEKERAKRLVNSIGDGVLTVGKDLRIRSFSPRLEELLGWKEDEVLGQLCSKTLRNEEHCPDEDCPIIWMKKGGVEVRNIRHPIYTASGEQIPIHITTAPITDPSGEIIGAIIIIRDIREIEDLRQKLEDRYSYSQIIGQSPKMEALFDLIERIADMKTPVLIQGESGTGKELVARALHYNSTRSDKPFVKINCSALPDPLLESELFGYEKGAFTGASKSKPGKFKLADGGTIFLDEIGDTSPAFQAKLLRVLQDHQFEPLGGTRVEEVDVRILAATNRDLKKEIAGGTFRKDLYYRICVVPIFLPPLRERKEDLPLLVQHFLVQLKEKYPDTHKARVAISPAVMKRLMDYPWPGNVRELKNIIERAFVCSQSGLIDVQTLPIEVNEQPQEAEVAPAPGREKDTEIKLFRYKDPEMVLHTLKKHRGNRNLTAKELGISRTTLWRMIRKIQESTSGNDTRKP